jgi:prepilin-type N-terminal cleavage/methylation domain-containing protein
MRRTEHGRRDDGFSLVEVTVTMMIISIVGVLFTTAILQVFNAANATQARSVVQAQTSQALLRLDREIRYAWYLGATSAGRPYVEYLIGAGNAQQCVQLRLADGQLQRRTWAHDGTAPAPTAWLPLASQVSSGAPFTRLDATGARGHQQLTVDLTAQDGNQRKHSNITFTALNTDQNTVSDGTGGTGAGTDEPCYDPGTRS